MRYAGRRKEQDLSTEAFSRAKIDALLADVGWLLTDGRSVHFVYTLPDGSRADYVLCDRRGHPVAVLEAKKMSTAPITAQTQGLHYARQLGVPFVFLSNGEEVRFLDADVDAHSCAVAGVFSQDDLERRTATRTVRRDLMSVKTDKTIAGGGGRDYQLECIDILCREVSLGRRKLLVEMATGTGKTRTAAAFIKRLFEAGHVTRVLFLVDRITLASQTLDAFVDYLKDYPAYVMKGGRRFDHAKRVTISTLQTMVNEYDQLSPGYFDLVITDECHRSIYGKWSGVLRHFDGVQLGLTARSGNRVTRARAARPGSVRQDRPPATLRGAALTKNPPTYSSQMAVSRSQQSAGADRISRCVEADHATLEPHILGQGGHDPVRAEALNAVAADQATGALVHDPPDADLDKQVRGSIPRPGAPAGRTNDGGGGVAAGGLPCQPGAMRR